MNRQTCWREILLSSRKTPWIKILSIPSKNNELPDQAFFCVTPKRIQFAPSLPEIISRGAVTTQESQDLHKAIRAARANGLFQTWGHINYAELLIVCSFTDNFLLKKNQSKKTIFINSDLCLNESSTRSPGSLPAELLPLHLPHWHMGPAHGRCRAPRLFPSLLHFVMISDLLLTHISFQKKK